MAIGRVHHCAITWYEIADEASQFQCVLLVGNAQKVGPFAIMGISELSLTHSMFASLNLKAQELTLYFSST